MNKLNIKKCPVCKRTIDISKDEFIKYDISQKSVQSVYRYFHEKCLPVYIEKKEKQRLINKDYDFNVEEKKKLNEIWEYVDSHISKLPESDSERYAWYISLSAIRNGGIQKVRGKKSDGTGYPYEVILMSFKSSYDSIHYALRTVHFENERHKRNYILKIVKNNLPRCYRIWMNQIESNIKLESIDNFDDNELNSAEYQKELYKKNHQQDSNADSLFTDEDFE